MELGFELSDVIGGQFFSFVAKVGIIFIPINEIGICAIVPLEALFGAVAGIVALLPAIEACEGGVVAGYV